MKLINLTQNKTLTNHLIVSDSLLKSTLGLLNQPPGTAMLFKTRWGIHTFGMRYPIDILIMDDLLKIVQIKKNLQPNRFFFWNPKYSIIVELSEKNNFRLEDTLQITK